MIAGGLALAGCSSKTDTDVDTTPSTDRAAADSLPSGFPSDVPVVNGDVQGDYFAGANGSGVWTLNVTGIDSEAFATAEQLLADAGFKTTDPAPTPGPCERRSGFDNTDTTEGDIHYTVGLCGNQTDTGYKLDYDVGVFPAAATTTTTAAEDTAAPTTTAADESEAPTSTVPHGR
ncbi:hypothetical protein AWC30_05320 [Mycolicibacillus trivialis]|uniref:Uncharacterized protein n=1 Tax=Mycolicibacillus trivialis TaxID=1798 RepID=A0A1X2EN06_9MYCO|nr:hypothetical protein AWC30_05320 [Mycolicibacillus trivialis]